MTLIEANGFEGGTPGDQVQPGDPLPGAPFDTVNIGTGASFAYDATHVMHGLQACMVSTPAGSSRAAWGQWDASLGGQHPTIWWRLYGLVPVLPSAAFAVVNLFQGGAAHQTATVCGTVRLEPSGALRWQDANGATILTTTAEIPAGAWFRAEGWLTGSASTGQVGISLFISSPDGTTADESDTSPATQDTFAEPDSVRFGVSPGTTAGASFWLDDCAASSAGPCGPAITSSDAGTGSGSTGALTAYPQDGDTEQAFDGGEGIAATNYLADADTGSGGDAGAIGAVPVSDSDAGSASDVPVVHVFGSDASRLPPVTSSDAGSFADSSGSVRAETAVQDADTLTGGEGGSHGPLAADTAAGSDASLPAGLASADSAAGTEGGSHGPIGPDAASGAEASSMTAHVGDADAGSGHDGK